MRYLPRLEVEKYLANVYSYLPDATLMQTLHLFLMREILCGQLLAPTRLIQVTGTLQFPMIDMPLLQRIRAASVYINSVEKCAECEGVTAGINIRTKARLEL
jgi:hypothetical protein